MKDMRTVLGNSGKRSRKTRAGLACTPHEPFEVKDHYEPATTTRHAKDSGFDDKQTSSYH